MPGYRQRKSRNGRSAASAQVRSGGGEIAERYRLVRRRGRSSCVTIGIEVVWISANPFDGARESLDERHLRPPVGQGSDQRTVRNKAIHLAIGRTHARVVRD